MAAYKVIWTDAAIADLRDICAYIGHHDRNAALKIGRGILEHVRILTSFPFIGPTYPRGASGPLREIVFGKYRIFYDVHEEGRVVGVLHVRHGARDEPSFDLN